MKSRSTSATQTARKIPTLEKEIEKIHHFLQNYVQIQSEGNIQRIMDQYAPDVVAYDVMPPLVFNGREIYRKAVENYFTKAFEFPIDSSWEDLQITLNGDTAFCHGLYRVHGYFKDSGEETEIWMRSTLCLAKMKGQWLITHIHNSVPVNDDGRALMDLDPASSFFH